ncbi:MAG: translation initiation factor IF-2 associated domain-containing protein, partial [Methylococcaceae bacterium]
MSDKTVRQLAEIVKIPLERLLEQLKEAGLSAGAPDDVINEDEKMLLLAHLRKRHGKVEGEVSNSPRRVTLERRKVTEIKQASVPGSLTKTIHVEVRKKKTYIKRSEVADADLSKTEELVMPVLAEPKIIEDVTVMQVEKLLPAEEPEVGTEQTSEEEEPVTEVVEIEPQVQAVVEPEFEADEAIESEAKFEALKIKEEKK